MRRVTSRFDLLLQSRARVVREEHEAAVAALVDEHSLRLKELAVRLLQGVGLRWVHMAWRQASDRLDCFVSFMHACPSACRRRFTVGQPTTFVRICLPRRSDRGRPACPRVSLRLSDFLHHLGNTSGFALRQWLLANEAAQKRLLKAAHDAKLKDQVSNER